MATVKEKNCIDCKEAFKPTSNVQKFCVKCAGLHKAAKNKTAGKKKKALVSRPIQQDSSSDSRVLSVLVAAGFVKQEHVDHCRNLLNL